MIAMGTDGSKSMTFYQIANNPKNDVYIFS